MNSTRTVLAVATASVLSLGAVACGSDDENTTSSASTPSTTTEQGTTETGTTETGTTETTPPPKKDEGDVIVVKGGEPDGGLKKLKLSTGDDAKITVESDQEANIHLHGYDIEKTAKPGEPAEFEFKADIPGIFTIEIEDTGTEIAELEVS